LIYFKSEAGNGGRPMKSDRTSITEQVMATVAAVSAVDAVELLPDTSLVNDLGLDSLGLFELVIEMEEIYDLRITDEDIDRIRTIDDIVDYIVRQNG
jgi:acyl carrier protein